MYLAKDEEVDDAIVVLPAGLGREACVEKITAAVHIAEQFATRSGEQHKQWVIDQMLRQLLGEDYPAWVALRNADKAKDEWNTGLAPGAAGS